MPIRGLGGQRLALALEVAQVAPYTQGQGKEDSKSTPQSTTVVALPWLQQSGVRFSICPPLGYSILPGGGGGGGG